MGRSWLIHVADRTLLLALALRDLVFHRHSHWLRCLKLGRIDLFALVQVLQDEFGILLRSPDLHAHLRLL